MTETTPLLYYTPVYAVPKKQCCSCSRIFCIVSVAVLTAIIVLSLPYVPLSDSFLPIVSSSNYSVSPQQSPYGLLDVQCVGFASCNPNVSFNTSISDIFIEFQVRSNDPNCLEYLNYGITENVPNQLSIYTKTTNPFRFSNPVEVWIFIHLPTSVTFNDFKMDAEVGRLRWFGDKSNPMKISDFQVNTRAGSVGIFDVSTSQMDIHTAAGSVDIKDISSDTIKIISKAGSVKTDDITLTDLIDIDSRAGSIQLDVKFINSSKLQRLVKAKSSAGSVSGSVKHYLQTDVDSRAGSVNLSLKPLTDVTTETKVYSSAGSVHVKIDDYKGKFDIHSVTSSLKLHGKDIHVTESSGKFSNYRKIGYVGDGTSQSTFTSDSLAGSTRVKFD
ncbi:hypothetical protein BC833DRAFT_622598 [Globomyces pollinis-pini]|nr:hypothetical protein BC833DRAFT_622598 [Globomyces pollinis-pini]